MKYAAVLLAGAADEPLDALEGRTPLEAAHIPHIDSIALAGRQGRVRTIPEGLPPGSDVACLSLFGYDPVGEYVARGPLEALARGVRAASDQLVFRCNLVTVVDGVLEDPTAGHISQPEADRLIQDLNEHVAGEWGRFHPGVSYRNLLVADPSLRKSPRCERPFSLPGRSVREHRPRGPGACWVNELTERAHRLLADHEVNLVRNDLGENPATDIWLWGQGRPRALEPFARRFGVRGAVVAGVDLVLGLARAVGMRVIETRGGAGYLDTDYVDAGRAATAALDEFELVLVHVETPDQAGHRGDLPGRIHALEQIDKHVVGPVLEKLNQAGTWRILVAVDHPTPIALRTHTAEPAPFCLAGHAVHTVLNRPFSEVTAAASDLQIDPGHPLMEYFLRP